MSQSLLFIALAAVVTGALAQAGSCGLGDDPDRIWSIAYGHDWGAFEYIDTGGYHRGFMREMVDLVCAAAGVKCAKVFDAYTNCIADAPGQHPILGTGLQAGYYDACLGWCPTIERIHFAKYSVPFSANIPAYIYYKDSFDISDMSGKTIGFLEGWAFNEKCVARELSGTPGIPLVTSQIRYYIDPLALKAAILSEEVDAGVSGMISFGEDVNNGVLKYVDNKPLYCILAGPAILARKDSLFPEVWNRGFDKVLRDGSFKKLCEEASEAHGHRGEINCVVSYDWSI